MIYSYLETPIGDLLIAGAEGALEQIVFPSEARGHSPDPAWREDGAALRATVGQLREYFAGRREEFALELNLRGTPFQLRVWAELQRIPFGETISYGELARRVGNPKASRAVGAANGRNPIPIVVPCHRVVGSDGTLTGFGGGLPIKRALLAHEQPGSRSQCRDAWIATE